MEVLLDEMKPNTSVVKACRGCLETEALLYDLSDTDSVKIFSEFTGHSVSSSDGYPQYICKLCLYLLRKFVRFRHRCIKAMYLLQQLEAEVGSITTECIKQLDRDKLQHNLVFTQTVTLEVTDTDTSSSDIIDIKQEYAETLQETDNRNDDLAINNDQILEHIEDVPKYDSSDFDEDDMKPLIIKTTSKKAKHKIGKKKRKLENTGNNTRSKYMKLNTEIHLDEELGNVSQSCKKRIEEIKRDIADGKCTVSKLRNYILHVKRLMKEAEEFNLDVIFLTKQEQILELEEMRKSERFNNAKYKCEKCCAIYRTADKLTRHTVSHNPSNGSFACDICGVRYKTIEHLNLHHIKRHKNKIICKTCGRIVTRDYKKHYEWHQGKHELYKCDQCDKQFTIKKQYLMHVVIIHGGHLKGPECLLCDDGRGFSSEGGLSVHMIRVHKANPRCPSCKTVFADDDALTVHSNVTGGCHTGCSCPKCGENFTNENEMKTHFNEKHRLGYYKCSKCPRQFQDLKQFNKHNRNHLKIPSVHSTNEKITVDYNRCEEKSCKQKGVNRACEVCGKLQSAKTYVIHMRTHTGEKPFQCDLCEKKFITNGVLQIHMLTHTGERKFKCHICLKTFMQSAHLKTHMVIHSGEKPHECDICKKRFGYTATLREHIRTVHEGLPPSRKNRVRRRKENAATQWIASQMDDSG